MDANADINAEIACAMRSLEAVRKLLILKDLWFKKFMQLQAQMAYFEAPYNGDIVLLIQMTMRMREFLREVHVYLRMMEAKKAT